jgi:phosphatidylglycerol:prolipoprotein diacylglycerol transferase
MLFLASVSWPVLDRFRFGSLIAISPHGIFIAIGFLIGAWVFGRLASSRGIEDRAVGSIVFWTLIGAIVGARFFYVVGHWSEFAPTPVEALRIWAGGISLLGGIAGATIANAINIRRFGLRFFQVADALTAPLALGIAIGRIGDLIIADHLGKPTSWLLAWRFSSGTVAPPFRPCSVGSPDFCATLQSGAYLERLGRDGAQLLDRTGQVIAQGSGVHQTALYDMILAWGLFAILWWFIKQPRREGLATLVFAIYYGCARLVEDFLRIDKRFGPLTGSQWTALTVVMLGVALSAYFAISKRPGPTSPARPPIRKRRSAPEPAASG